MRHRLAAILPTFLLTYLACYRLAFLLRFDFKLPEFADVAFWVTLPAVIAAKFLACWLTGEWRRTFRHAAVTDLVPMAFAAAAVNALLYALNSLALPGLTVPRSVILIDLFLTIFAVGAVRITYRTYFESIRPRIRNQPRESALIFGVRQPSIGILRMLNTTSAVDHPYRVVGFIDDSPRPQKSLIAGLPVFSHRKSWRKLKEKTRAGHLLIPGDVPGRIVRDLLRTCHDVGIRVHVIPSIDELVDGRFKLSVRDVTVSDLLRREPNRLDMDAIKDYVTGRRVLVTGAAGSIGSELCRQLLQLKPAALLLLDQSEFGMFTMEREFAHHAGEARDVDLRYIMADVLDEPTINRLMEEHRPQLVFHAAAYKHVPLMEDNPQAAVLNNILGTKTVADAASRHGVERFVLVSTDKAVRPTSVMGATKLVAEKYVQSLARHSNTRFITVRFGNVLNSMGSVVPTFRQQIEAGGPVTITHEEMKRFFMTIPEAVQLVIQAGAIGESGQVLILDMGEPVKIVDLAKDMIMLSGLRYPDDVDIVVTGIRPGEKLYEELFYSAESDARRVHEKIFCGDADSAPPLPKILADVRRLEEAAYGPNQPALKALQQTVAEYTDADWTPARLQTAA